MPCFHPNVSLEIGLQTRSQPYGGRMGRVKEGHQGRFVVTATTTTASALVVLTVQGWQRQKFEGWKVVEGQEAVSLGLLAV